MKVIDLHCDTILRLMEEGAAGNLYRNNYCVDIEKLRQANAQAQFFAMFINAKKTADPLERVLTMIDRFYTEIELNSEYIALARDYGELMENRAEGKISAFLTIEEGAALKGNLSTLRNFYRLGVRLITLTWNYPNEIGYPNHEFVYQQMGLTAFGQEVVAEMNRLGMIIDVSHLSDKGFYDVAALASKPFIASHSNSRTLTAHSRNLTDDMIKVLADKGGVVGINFEKSFLGEAPVSKVEDMVRHINFIRNIGGIDVVAIGSDFDGIDTELELADASEMYKLMDTLAKRGFSEDEIEKICWKNAERVIKAVLG